MAEIKVNMVNLQENLCHPDVFVHFVSCVKFVCSYNTECPPGGGRHFRAGVRSGI